MKRLNPRNFKYANDNIDRLTHDFQFGAMIRDVNDKVYDLNDRTHVNGVDGPGLWYLPSVRALRGWLTPGKTRSS